MELYVERAFLDNFCIEYNEEAPSPGQKILASIFEEYGEIEWFIDTEINTQEEFEELELNYYFFARRSDYKAPIGVNSLSEEIFKNSSFRQTLVFTASEKDWFKEAESKGALCFSYDNYEEKLQKIITNCHYKIDLSENFKSWQVFEFFKWLPLNSVLINDNYLLADKSNQPMDRNIIALLKVVLEEKRSQETSVKIFTKDLNPLQPKGDEQVKDAVEKRYNKLNSGLANYKKKIRIINNSLKTELYDLHDRVLMTNFLSIDSGKGFNLMPHKTSNSQIIVETIFDLYTYKRMKNHQKIYDEYYRKLEKIETVKFKIYPS